MVQDNNQEQKPSPKTNSETANPSQRRGYFSEDPPQSEATSRTEQQPVPQPSIITMIIVCLLLVLIGLDLGPWGIVPLTIGVMTFWGYIEERFMKKKNEPK